MLELGDSLRAQVQELVDAVGPLQCGIELPWWWKGDAGPTGPLPTRYSDRRRHPRFHYRLCAALEHRQTLPSLPRPRQWHQIFTKDLSRGGLSFLHSEQLFPRERMRLVLPRRGMSQIEIVCCNRVQEDCYQVGARFVEPPNDLKP